ncbi:MAG: isocitrate lyase/phosphoenolpyruvate mutase family protein [Pyrinomonadaceae bacterium]
MGREAQPAVAEESGAKAIATESWSVAAADGFADGENLSLDAAVPQSASNASRHRSICPLRSTSKGATADNSELAANIERVIKAGAIGINFEDQIVGGEGLILLPNRQNTCRDPQDR